MNNQHNQRKDIGALWEKFSKNGNAYLTGYVEINGIRHRITVFANSFKQADTHPDFKIYPANEQQQQKQGFDKFKNNGNNYQKTKQTFQWQEEDNIPY